MNRRERAQADWAASNAHEVAGFLGPNSGAFRSAYERGREKMTAKGNALVYGWSWPAFVFGFAWFLYRKQWAVGAVLLIAPIALSFVSERNSGLVGVAIAMAVFAKSFIVQDAVAKIAKIKANGGAMDEIAAAGGVSKVAGAIGGAIWLAAAVAAIVTLLAGPRP